MSRITDDPKDPGIVSGFNDDEPAEQNEAYLVLSEAERAKGFVRPIRHSYKHVGLRGPTHPTRELTEGEQHRYYEFGYVLFESYPPREGGGTTGRFWTQDQLDLVGRGCGGVTTMHQDLAETWARSPTFYGSTYCTICMKHRPVAEFVWNGTDIVVGT